MATDTKLQELVINTMTKAQYDALETKDPNEIYVATDAKTGAQDLDTSNVGTTGQVLSKTDTGMEWVDMGGASGDYLPLAGGTIIGNFPSSNPAITVSSESSDVYAFTMRQSGGYGVSFYANAVGGFTILPFSGTKYLYFGNMLYNNKTYKLSNVKILNNGADINIPTTGGTMVVATPPTDEGTYTLKATVAADGTVTTTWVKDA